MSGNIIKNLNFEMRKKIKKHENDSFALDNLLILKHLYLLLLFTKILKIL